VGVGMIPSFRGRVEKGVLQVDSRYYSWLSTLEGLEVEVIVRKRRSQRSLNQNAAYWRIVVESLAEHLGYDKDTMHQALKEKFASRRDGNGLLIVESTAKMDTARFNKYYEDIQRWASEFLNFYIPDPNEYETPARCGE